MKITKWSRYKIFAPIFLAWLALQATPGWAGSAELTRYLGSHERTSGSPNYSSETFFADAGPATLRLTDLAQGRASQLASASVLLNGDTVLGPRDFRKQQQVFEIPVTLLQGSNQIEVKLAGKPGSGFQLRVKQQASIDVNIFSRIHFNTNVSNFPLSRDFYDMLGLNFSSDFPQTNTLAVAEGIGVDTPTDFVAAEWEERLAEDLALGFAIGDDGGYLLKGQLVALPNFGGSFIDLIEFTIPRNDEPPYAAVNHLGMAMAAFETANIDYDYDYMTAQGIEFLSAPATNADGETFAVFKDLDGTFYQLLETASDPIDFDGDGQPDINTNINRIGKVSINVSDLERSVAYYKLLGFSELRDVYGSGTPAVAAALGMPDAFARVGKLMGLPDGSQVELIQWLTPFDPEPPYPLPVNHFGIDRIAFFVPNVTAAAQALLAQGFELISPIAPCCSGDSSTSGLIAFFDPDGTVLELFGAL